MFGCIFLYNVLFFFFFLLSDDIFSLFSRGSSAVGLMRMQLELALSLCLHL